MQVEVQGNNLNFLLFYTPQPQLPSFVWEQQSVIRKQPIGIWSVEIFLEHFGMLADLKFFVHSISWLVFLSSSLRVSLDLGKVVYSWMIIHDKAMPGTVVRSSTIPEELGRIGYLLSDKTGTLSENEMVLD